MEAGSCGAQSDWSSLEGLPGYTGNSSFVGLGGRWPQSPGLASYLHCEQGKAGVFNCTSVSLCFFFHEGDKTRFKLRQDAHERGWQAHGACAWVNCQPRWPFPLLL